MIVAILCAVCVLVGGFSTFVPFLIWLIADREDDTVDFKKDMKRELERVRDDIEDEWMRKTDNRIDEVTYYDGLMTAIDIVDRRLARFEEGENNVHKHSRI